jgi:archaellin
MLTRIAVVVVAAVLASVALAQPATAQPEARLTLQIDPKEGTRRHADRRHRS